MGMIYELLSTPVAYAWPPYYRRRQPERANEPVRIDFGPDPLQHCVLWEPATVKHPEIIMYFHGGGYLVGAPESMGSAADVYNTMGYRFCSVGFRLMPRHRFPAQVDDAFVGVKTAIAWLESRGVDASRIVLGGSSCGGHLAYLLAYSHELQRAHAFDGSRVRGVISVAGVAEADDMLLKYFCTPRLRRAFLDVLPEGKTTRNAAADARLGAGRSAVSHAGSEALGGGRSMDGIAWSKREVHGALRRYSPLYLVQRTDVPAVPLFVLHGRTDKMSPYVRSVELVEALNQQHPGVARLHTIDSWWWQHMILTVCLHRQSVDKSAPLQALFRWLSGSLAPGE